MAISVVDTDLRVLNMTRRMTFHFGNVHVSEGPQVLLAVTVDVDGEHERGLSMGALSPMWFKKDPDMSLADGIDDMLEVFETACEHAEAIEELPTVFALWRSLYGSVGEWGDESPHPALLWNYGVSLVEQAVIDAYCRSVDTTFHEAVHQNEFGIELEAFYDELSGVEPVELLPDEPLAETAVRHTVGLSDPLTTDDVSPTDRVDDGLPQTLSEYVAEQGIDHFKIKLAATDDDAERLKRIKAVVERELDDYAFSLDANEQYASVAAFQKQWEDMRSDDELAEFFDNLLYVEQPLPRDQAFSDDTRETFADWDDHPPVIIDESDDRFDKLETALECGYAGTSHKNCKGVFKGIANRCLVEHRRRSDDDREYLISGEDLTTLAPVELQEDLAVMATIGADHVERNGHHYYRGLSMLPEDVQEAALESHGDLFRRHDEGFATLAIRDGSIRFDSVLDAPFGYDLDVDPELFTPVEEWSVDSIYE